MAPITFTTGNQSVSVKVGDLASSALREIGVGGQGETVSAEDSQWLLEKIQQRIDLINAQSELIYAVNFNTFTTPASTQPITIGPDAQFNVSAVPIRIESATWILPGSSPVDLPPMRILSDDEWAAVTLKSLTSTLPTALYYSRGASQGNIYLLPIPTSGNQIRLQLWNVLAQAINANTTIALPPAYWMYLLCAVAADAAPSYGPQALEIINSSAFMLKYREARAAILGNSSDTAPLRSDVPGVKRGNAVPDFNFLTGQRG